MFNTKSTDKITVYRKFNGDAGFIIYKNPLAPTLDEMCPKDALTFFPIELPIELINLLRTETAEEVNRILFDYLR